MNADAQFAAHPGKPMPPDIAAQMRLDYTRPESIYELVQIDEHKFLVVFGDDGASEWCVAESRKVQRYSNTGYGDRNHALRDGLIAYYGAPRFEFEQSVVNKP